MLGTLFRFGLVYLAGLKCLCNVLSNFVGKNIVDSKLGVLFELREVSEYFFLNGLNGRELVKIFVIVNRLHTAIQIVLHRFVHVIVDSSCDPLSLAGIVLKLVHFVLVDYFFALYKFLHT